MKHKRIFIYPKDIKILMDKSGSQAGRILKDIKVHFNKKQHQKVTIEECADYFGIEAETIYKSIFTLLVLLSKNMI